MTTMVSLSLSIKNIFVKPFSPLFFYPLVFSPRVSIVAADDMYVGGDRLNKDGDSPSTSSIIFLIWGDLKGTLLHP